MALAPQDDRSMLSLVGSTHLGGPLSTVPFLQSPGPLSCHPLSTETADLARRISRGLSKGVPPRLLGRRRDDRVRRGLLGSGAPALAAPLGGEDVPLPLGMVWGVGAGKMEVG